jgi:hypothetical protein
VELVESKNSELEPREFPAPFNAIQKLRPSLQAPIGVVVAPVLTEPSGVRSAAFHSETLSPKMLVTSIRSPSNAAACGPFNPLPVSVASTAPVDARTTYMPFEPSGTQMFVPSKTGNLGLLPRVTVWMMAPFESSLKRRPGTVPPSVTQILAPSYRIPIGELNPDVT